MIKSKIINLYKLSRGINNNCRSSLPEVFYDKKIQNILQLIREQQRPKKVSVNLQSNFTETTHQHGNSPMNSNSID